MYRSSYHKKAKQKGSAHSTISAIKMTYRDDDIEKQLALLRHKDLPKDMMRFYYTMKNRNNSFKRTNDSTYNNSDQLFPFKDDSQLSVTNVNAHQNWCNQCAYRDNWRHKYTSSPTSSCSRSSEVFEPGFHEHSRHNWQVDPQVDEEPLQQNRQNNACMCGNCYGFPSDVYLPTTRATRMPSYESCEEPRCDPDSRTNCDLNEIYEKIRKLADLRRHQSLMAGCYEPYIGVTEGLQSPSVLSPPREPPHTRSLVRVKPYKRHQMYQRMWKVQPAIGDNFRFTLRQKVRQKMLQKEEVQLPHKMFVPNMYVVPTVKPRYDLRWIVRKCNHDYKMPPCGVFHDDV